MPSVSKRIQESLLVLNYLLASLGFLILCPKENSETSRYQNNDQVSTTISQNSLFLEIITCLHNTRVNPG